MQYIIKHILVAIIALTFCSSVNADLKLKYLKGQLSSSNSQILKPSNLVKLTLKELRRRKSSKLITSTDKLFKTASPNYSGGWHGRFILTRDDCDLFNSSFLFRHIIRYGRSNTVGISTSHDGMLYGISRNKGKRLETRRIYSRSGTPVDVILIYDRLKSGSASAALGVEVGGECIGIYGASSIRAY